MKAWVFIPGYRKSYKESNAVLIAGPAQLVTQWVEYNILFILDRALSHYGISPHLFVLLPRNLFKGKECLLELGLNINWKGLFLTGGKLLWAGVHSSLPIPGGNTPQQKGCSDITWGPGVNPLKEILEMGLSQLTTLSAEGMNPRRSVIELGFN